MKLQSLEGVNGYDLIGDIHGQSIELVNLLQQLSYENINGVWQHPERKIIFLGDFIDAGSRQKEVIDIVRPMVENQHAYAVMGNHEYNAIAYYTKDVNGNYLRPHSENKSFQHEKFLQAYADSPAEYQSVIEWFKTIPLWIELDNIRVVHACWDADSIAHLKSVQFGSNLLGSELLYASSIMNSLEYHAVTTILKGKKETLPEGESFVDRYGKTRTKTRTEWWKSYPEGDIPVFFGHYWMKDDIKPLSSNIACVDYSVARQGGSLVAYRWDGEQVLENHKFIYVERVEE